MSRYGVISGSFPAFGLNTDRYLHLSILSPNAGKYRPEITPFLDTFHAVRTAKYLRQGVLARCVRKIFKNSEIIRTHGETGRNEPTWGNLHVMCVTFSVV